MSPSRPRHIGPARQDASSSWSALLDLSPIWWFTASLDCAYEPRALSTFRTWPTRFETRLREGPPIVADGGMGSLLTAAVPRLRSPEEANLRAPEAVVSLHVSFINAGAELIETNTFGANRRKLASHYLEDELERINSTGVKLAREARELSGRDVFIAGSIGPLGEAASSEKRRELFAEQAAVLEGRGVDLFMIETFFDLDELVDAIAAVRSVSSLPIVALLTFDEDAETLAGVTARQAAERLAELDVAAFGANHGAGLLAALTALEQMQADGRAARGAAEHRPREPARRPGHLPARDARVLRRVRRARARPRRARDRRLLRHDARPRSPRSAPRSTPSGRCASGSTRTRARSAAALGEEQRETGLAPGAARGRVRRLGPARPAARRLEPRAARGRAASSRPRASSAFVDVNDNATARAGMSALIVSVRDRARDRARDDPAPDDARLDRPRARVAAARRARRGRPQRARDHRRPARGRRLPGLAGRLRDRLDRPHAPDRAAEPRRGLQRPADRRADLVLPRRRREPDRRRPRARGRAVPREDRRPARGSR